MPGKRKETARPKLLLTSRRPTNIATWNVRTMYAGGKAAMIAVEMRRYKISLLGLGETRWLQSGQVKLASGETILYSGHPDDSAPHTQGVAFMLSKEAQRALISWEPINSRIITAKFQTTHKKINLQVVQCYAPTNDTDDETKDQFYNQLHHILQSRKEKDIMILMGDMNAKIGGNNNGYELIMGKEGPGTMNENGERFAEACADNNLVIGGSVFQHKNIHKITWVSADHITENQIDHICISQKFRHSLLDVRARRAADAGSDHHLLTAKIQLKLKAMKHREGRVKFNIQQFQDIGTTELYKIALHNRYQALEIEIETPREVDEIWKGLKNMWKDTCEEVVGRRKTDNKPWLSTDTTRKVSERRGKKEALNRSKTRATKMAAKRDYAAANKEVKKSVRRDKKKYIEDLAQQAEEAAGKNNLKDLYLTTKKLTDRFRHTQAHIKNAQGVLLTTKEDQVKRWTEHFRALLNRQAPHLTAEIPPSPNLVKINCNPPTKPEIKKAIKTLRGGKAEGPDGIPAEALKADIETSTNMLYHLLKTIWEEECVPSDWKDGHIVKIPKKGDLRDCKNYRGIMLLSTPGKVLNRILLERLQKGLDEKLRENQAGFRENRSCGDQTATLRIIIEKSIEWNTSVYVNFIDFEKAFDSVDREMLWKLTAHYGIPAKITNIIRSTYQGMRCQVLHEGCISEPFEVLTGVRQGCLLSPLLFLLCVDWIMIQVTCNSRTGIQWSMTEQLEDLDFADDLALLAHTQQQMQEKSGKLEDTAALLGLKTNSSKTKVMRINSNNNTPITMNQNQLEEVASFTYLGTIISVDGGTEEDVRARIGKARATFNMLNNIWKMKNLSLKTKLQIFNSNVKSTLLYGSETWKTTTNILNKLQTFTNRCLRRLLGIYWPNTISNANLWELTKQETIETQIRRRKWKWIGHTLRRQKSITKQALTWNPQGKRKRGRPRTTWRRTTEQEMKKEGLSWPQLERRAQDRRGWRGFVDGLCSFGNLKA